MGAQTAAYDFTRGIIDMVFVLWPIAGPFVVMGVVITVFRWVSGWSRSEDDGE